MGLVFRAPMRLMQSGHGFAPPHWKTLRRFAPSEVAQRGPSR